MWRTVQESSTVFDEHGKLRVKPGNGGSCRKAEQQRQTQTRQAARLTAVSLFRHTVTVHLHRTSSESTATGLIWCHNHTLNSFIMSTPYSVRTTEPCVPQSPSSPGLPASRDDLADQDDSETSPLLGTYHPHALQSPRSHSEWWHSTRSSVSTFFDKNAGLCLITASEFFFSAMNISVKWLNGLDEPIPILEVRVSSRMVGFSADITLRS